MARICDDPYLRQTTWKGRDEDKSDASVWAVTCFMTRAGYRHQGVSRALVRGTIGLARDRGARAVEAYPMKPAPGKEVTWGEMHVGGSARSSVPASASCARHRCGAPSCATTSRSRRVRSRSSMRPDQMLLRSSLATRRPSAGANRLTARSSRASGVITAMGLLSATARTIWVATFSGE